MENAKLSMNGRRANLLFRISSLRLLFRMTTAHQPAEDKKRGHNEDNGEDKDDLKHHLLANPRVFNQ